MTDSTLVVFHPSPSRQLSKDEWAAVLRLAKLNSDTLGFLPDRAFSDRLRKGHLAIATAASQVVGYCLYDRPRAGYIKLVHVCIDGSTRKAGTGQLLVKEVVAHNPDATGILAHCRRDYVGVDRFWQSVGMSPRVERAGRKASGSTLSTWWRPLGGYDLLEGAALDAGLPLVAYDTNVVSDLYASDDVERPDRGASRGLLAGWLQAAITPAISPHVDVELNRIDEATERKRQMELSQELIRLRSVRADDPSVLNELRMNLGPDALGADASLHDDLCHLADAITAGATYVVTNDDNFLRLAPTALGDRQEPRVVRPHTLVTEVLASMDAPAFRPSVFIAPTLDWRPAVDYSIDSLVDTFLVHEKAERAAELTRAIRTALAQHPQSTRVLVDERERLWALAADSMAGRTLRVGLFRVRRGDVASTVAYQLARHVRERAWERDLTEVSVSDASLSMVCVDALLLDGFRQEGADYRADLVQGVWTRDGLKQAGWAIDGEDTRAIERRLWPLALVAEPVPTFLVPIRPRYAKRLFGLHDDALWSDRKRGLGLSREHVYFSGSNRAVPPTGARLLWYATGDDTDTLQQVVAYSRSCGFERMLPSKAHAANAHLGVLRLRDVQKAAGKDGLVTVLRFEDTRILDSPIERTDIEAIALRHAAKPPFLSFRRMSAAVFDEVLSTQATKP